MTLTPFVYGLAFDSALVHPNTRMFDAFPRLQDDAANDFDGDDDGTVTAAEALRLSLDGPAVALVERIGADRLNAELAAAGVPLTVPRDQRPGPDLFLGTAAVALEHLVALYATLGSDGRARPCASTLKAEARIPYRCSSPTPPARSPRF